MGLGATLFVTFAGWSVGLLVFVALLRWPAIPVATVAERRSQGKSPAVSGTVFIILLRSIFHAAPWLLLTLGFVGYQIREEPWSSWLYIGFAASFAVMAVITLVTAVRLRRKYTVGK